VEIRLDGNTISDSLKAEKNKQQTNDFGFITKVCIKYAIHGRYLF